MDEKKIIEALDAMREDPTYNPGEGKAAEILEQALAAAEQGSPAEAAQ